MSQLGFATARSAVSARGDAYETRAVSETSSLRTSRSLGDVASAYCPTRRVASRRTLSARSSARSVAAAAVHSSSSPSSSRRPTETVPCSFSGAIPCVATPWGALLRDRRSSRALALPLLHINSQGRLPSAQDARSTVVRPAHPGCPRLRSDTCPSATTAEGARARYSIPRCPDNCGGSASS